MKTLLNKTFKSIALYSLVVLGASVPAYYYLVDRIWLRELDEHNEIIADRIENGLNRLNLGDTEISKSVTLWSKIQPGSSIKELSETVIRPDSTYTIYRQNPYVEHKEIDRFRGLLKIIEINGKAYELTIETNVEETEETVVAIALVTFLFFLILVIGFLLLNKRLSARLWTPFRNTLSKLKTFNLNSQIPIEFDKTDTLEFEELNGVLQKLISQNISTYKTQKEFTENASHELQTPLAIIKNKLDLLLQKETLTDRQYQIIEEANKALTRITRINKNLLLLTNLDNNQFADVEIINITQLTQQCIEQLKEHFNNKSLTIQTEIESDILIKGNKTLIEVLLNNLLLNAIRHNVQNGIIAITLKKNELNIANSGNRELNKSMLFKRFAKTSNESAGSGLGLAIIRQICHRHRWTVQYQFEGNNHIFSIGF